MHIPVTADISLTEFRPSDKATCIERIGDRDIYDRTLRIPHPVHRGAFRPVARHRVWGDRATRGAGPSRHP
jgi:hypothetical protein